MIGDLYMEVILEQSRSPRNFGRPEKFTHDAEGNNPLCGDRIHVYATVIDGRIENVSFEGNGCAICTSSASMMTLAATGLDTLQVDALHERFHEMVTAGTDDSYGELGDLAAFQGVRKYPIRIKCATLPWHALRSALRGEQQPATTEE